MLRGDAEETAELLIGIAAARASRTLSLGSSRGPTRSGMLGLSGLVAC